MIQSLVHGIFTAAWIMLVAVGFGLIFQCGRFFNFAHGIVFTAAAYFTYLFKVWLGVSLEVSLVLAVVISTLLGCLPEILIYRPLRRRNSPPLVLLLASLGFYTMLQNLIEIIFGKDTKTVRSGVVEEGIHVVGTRLTTVQIITILIGFVVAGFLAVHLRRTRLGKQMRAVAADPELASVCGVDPDRIILWTFVIGSALAAVAGVLVALDVDMTPTMGMHAFMMAVVAAIIGGTRSIAGVIFGSIFLGLILHLGAWWISSTWQDAVAFVILVGFLLFKPDGFMGKKVSKERV